MLSVAEFVAKASVQGPPMPGIILGVRMSVLALKLLGIDDPAAYHRKLIVVVETDRCLPDVIELVTGCRLGNRTLKFRDWGKMAATFSDVTRSRAFRVAARESVEAEAFQCFPALSREQALSEAYKTFGDERLFRWGPAIVKFSAEDLPGCHRERVLCQKCGEGIGFGREVHRDGLTLCRACAGEAYWLPEGTG